MGLGWEAARRRSFQLGLVPALFVLASITVAPGLFLLVTSLTPLNLAVPSTWFDFSYPLGNYVDLMADERFVNSVVVQLHLSTIGVALQLAMRSMDAMQTLIGRLKLAAYSPDIVVEIPRDICGFFDFHRARDLIEFGRRRAAASLDLPAGQAGT